jgi:hypothetical protein
VSGGTSVDVVSAEVAREAAPAFVAGATASEPLEYDLLRVIIWSLTRASEPVHVLRVLNCALEIASGALGGDDAGLRERLRSCLEELSEAGDAVSLDEGRWMPAPVRVVPLAGAAAPAPFVGGVPTTLLAPELRKDVLAHGAFRRLRTRSITASLSLPSETLESWTRYPSQTLEEWGRGLLDAPLSEYREPKRDESAFRIYAPENARRGATQLRRWEDRFSDLSGRYLAERARVFGAREYRVVELVRGRVARSGAILAPGEDRRLRYAVDALAQNPTRVQWKKSHGDVTVTLWSEVPRSEQRLFGALGCLELTEGYYPRRWHFAHDDAPLVRERLTKLSVSIQDA